MFKVGDMVVVDGLQSGVRFNRTRGRIVSVDRASCGVDFSGYMENYNFHRLLGNLPTYTGYYIDNSKMKLLRSGFADFIKKIEGCNPI